MTEREKFRKGEVQGERDQLKKKRGRVGAEDSASTSQERKLQFSYWDCLFSRQLRGIAVSFERPVITCRHLSVQLNLRGANTENVHATKACVNHSMRHRQTLHVTCMLACIRRQMEDQPAIAFVGPSGTVSSGDVFSDFRLCTLSFAKIANFLLVLQSSGMGMLFSSQ